MNVTFQDPPNTLLPSAQRCRQYVEQLKKFILSSENPNISTSQASAGLTEVGFLLLRLKDQLLSTDQRSITFPSEFASKQYNGVVLLIKTVYVLQGIVNIINNKSSKFSSLLNRKNSATNVRRKASVSEADCMECIKLALEKAHNSWQTVLESPQNLEVICYSVNSPQLDSKCYSLEIIINLLDQPHGFEHLFRSLSVIAARTGDYARLAIIVAQLKHGLHTAKLHIQILVARLINKLMIKAPTNHHRLLVQAEAGLAHYSPEYVEKLLITVTGPLGGREVLTEELNSWKNLCTSTGLYHHGGGSKSNDSGHGRTPQPSYESSDDSHGRRRVRTTFKTPPAQTSLTKNIERQRLRRHGGNGQSNGSTQNNYYNNEYTQTLSKTGDINSQANYSPRNVFVDDVDRYGRMRRVKSESAMGIEDVHEDENSYPTGTHNRRLKRFDNEFSDYAVPPPVNPPNPYNAKLSRSIHDLSAAHMSPSLTDSMPRRSAEAPGKFYTGNASGALYQPNYESATLNRAFRTTISPTFSNASSQNEPLPGHRSSQLPPTHGGFSYLFPTLPVVERVVGRPKTPDNYLENKTPMDYHHNKPYPAHPAQPLMGTTPVKDNQGNVVYIPINMVDKAPHGHGDKLLSPRTIQMPDRSPYSPRMMSPMNDGRTHAAGGRYDKRRQTDAAMYPDNNNLDQVLQNKGTVGNALGEDVRDALREFDYLNDYDAASVRSGTVNPNPTAIYHF